MEAFEWVMSRRTVACSDAAMQAPQSPNLPVPIPVRPIFGFPQLVGTKRGSGSCIALPAPALERLISTARPVAAFEIVDCSSIAETGSSTI